MAFTYKIMAGQDNAACEKRLQIYMMRMLLQPEEASPDAMHGHSYHQLYYICSGRAVHIMNGRRDELTRGDVALIPVGSTHGLFSNVGAEIVFIDFDADMLDGYSDTNGEDVKRLLASDDLPPRFTLSSEACYRVEQCLRSIERLDINSYCDTTSDYLARAYLLALLWELQRDIMQENHCRRWPAGDGSASIIQNGLKFIDENFRRDISSEDIAKHLYISLSHFRHLFREQTGKTFTQFLSEKRIQHALALLRETGLPITEICLESGFNNLSHFLRVFKASVGMSPTQYRRAALAKETG